MCNVSGTAAFSPALSKTGSNTGKGSTEKVTLEGFTLSNCLSPAAPGAPTSGSIASTSISVPATKLGSGSTAQYLTGYCPGFASTTSLKALKKLLITTNWSGGEGSSTQIVTKSATVMANHAGEVGFSILGKFVTGSYGLKVVQITVYLTPADSNALATQCASGPVSSISFDGATSTVLQ